MPTQVTMDDVAELAGVARSTVSHVINNRGDVLHISKATQRRIRQSIRDLNYRLHAGARSICQNRSGCLGVLAVSPGWRLSKQQLSGINRAVKELDCHLLYFEFDAAEAGGEYMPKMIRERLIDGLIIPQSMRMPEHIAEAIKRCNLPAIWIHAQQPTDAVWLDESHYGREATQHLVDLGHRRICFVAMGDLEGFWNRDRRRGYEETMVANGLTIDVVGRDRMTRPERPAFFRELLGRADRPTALLVHWISAAIPAMHEACQLNLRVPQDLSIVSVADEGAFNMVVPALTYWDNHDERLGYEACKMLIRKIELGGRPQPARVLKGDLILGDTTAPPPGTRNRQT